MLNVDGRARVMPPETSGRYFAVSPFPQRLSSPRISATPSMHVLLDLYGVLLDHEKMFRGYRERLAALLTARFGGDPDAWRRAHDEAWVTYVQRVNAADWEWRGYADVVDDLDARHLVEMFDRAGVRAPPTDALSVSRELEREAMARVNARYPDARTAIERLRAAGPEAMPSYVQATLRNLAGLPHWVELRAAPNLR